MSGPPRSSAGRHPRYGAVGSVILLDPHADIDVPLPGEVPVMDQYGRMFYPLFLLVRKGQTIRFTNSEDDLHTVHVKDSAGESLFNIATLFGSSYESRRSTARTLTTWSATPIPRWRADILVVSSPYAVPGGQRRRLHPASNSDAAGTYTVTLLNGEDRRERDVEIVAGRNEIDLRVRAEINPTDLSQQCHQLEMCFCRHDSIVPIRYGLRRGQCS